MELRGAITKGTGRATRNASLLQQTAAKITPTIGTHANSSTLLDRVHNTTLPRIHTTNLLPIERLPRNHQVVDASREKMVPVTRPAHSQIPSTQYLILIIAGNGTQKADRLL